MNQASMSATNFRQSTSMGIRSGAFKANAAATAKDQNA
jgi:hypothetical protein